METKDTETGFRPKKARFVWAFLYIIILVVSSPIFPSSFVDHVFLPWVESLNRRLLPALIADGADVRTTLEQHFIVQALLANLFLTIYTVLDTFLRNKINRFDLFASWLCGFSALVTVILIFTLYISVNFLYVTCAFAIFYVALDAAGWALQRTEDRELSNTLKHYLIFVDFPTLVTSIAFIGMPAHFVEGVGAAILLFSGVTWIAVTTAITDRVPHGVLTS